MRNLLYILVLLTSIPEMFSQSSLEFKFDKEFVSVPNNFEAFDTIKIYRGRLNEEEINNTSTVLGKTITNTSDLQFVPIVPFTINQEYTLVYADFIEYFSLSIPDSYSYTTVTSVYPSAKELPANLLKWYIKFSNPISETLIYDHIKFINEQGDTLPRAALALKTPLVSDDGTLLTVWVEPGRQKRDLIPNQQLGAVFQKGKSYTLLIQKKLKDKTGITMRSDFRHQFHIISADRKQPEINMWTIDPPTANSTYDLVIHCNESLDYGSALHSLMVLDKNDNEIDGRWQLKNHETILSFTPLTSWSSGTYKILCNPSLEDLAGNNLERLFDREVKNLPSNSIPKQYALDFIIK